MTPLRCSSSTPASAARLFVQLSCARRTTNATAASSSPILDVLLPRSSLLLPAATRSIHGSSSSAGSRKGGLRSQPGPTVPTTSTNLNHSNSSGDAHTIRSSQSHVFASSSWGFSPRCRHHHHHHHHNQRALFSTTAAMRKTEVIYNPQQDEDGSEMLMEITPRAANRLSKIMAQDQNPDLALRIQVESGGCHGFQYLMSLTTLPPLPPSASASASASASPSTSSSSPPSEPPSPSEEVAAEVTPSTTTSNTPTSTPDLREDDTVFAFVKEEEGQQQQPPSPSSSSSSSSSSPPKIVLDGPSLQLLRGSKVDYTMELIGSQFKISDNPHATSSCGCGTSFDIKDL